MSLALKPTADGSADQYHVMHGSLQIGQIDKCRAAMLAVAAAVSIIVLHHAMIVTANARDIGQWGDKPAFVRQWFQSLMQPDHPHLSCCGEADAYEADTFEIDGDHYVAVITEGKGVLAPGTRIDIPNTKMKWDEGNPTGHGIVSSAPRGKCTATSRRAVCKLLGPFRQRRHLQSADIFTRYRQRPPITEKGRARGCVIRTAMGRMLSAHREKLLPERSENLLRWREDAEEPASVEPQRASH
jgi:hypothetical protein